MAVKIEEAQFSKESIKSKFTILVAFYFAQIVINWAWESFWMQDNIITIQLDSTDPNVNSVNEIDDQLNVRINKSTTWAS